MVAVIDRAVIENSVSQDKFFSLETLASVTGKKNEEAIKLLGQAKAVILPMEDGSVMITEESFDAAVLLWAKSFKGESAPQAQEPKPKQAKQPKLLTSKLTTDDISKVKTGKTAGAANLTNKGVQETLEKFFNKLALDDTTQVDAVSAFIEGTSELGINLRKEILGAMKRFTKGTDLATAETKLVAGAKAYLENMSLAAESGEQS